ncbi:LRRFIP2 [Branchiostoma lanceolatum]|nr:LRRFIP2 [Branchiostoma lanceolatum]
MASKSQMLRQAKSLELPENENLGLSSYVLGRRQHQQSTERLQKEKEDLEEERWEEKKMLEKKLRYANDRVSELQMEMDKVKAHVTSLEATNRTLKTLAKK